jgi:hypothetical protein
LHRWASVIRGENFSTEIIMLLLIISDPLRQGVKLEYRIQRCYNLGSMQSDTVYDSDLDRSIGRLKIPDKTNHSMPEVTANSYLCEL